MIHVVHGEGPVIPYLIDWRGSASPADTAPGGCSLSAITALHPQPAVARRMLDAMSLSDQVVEHGAHRGLRLDLDTPSGGICVQ